MKRLIISTLVCLLLLPAARGERLVILHTNDTHSTVDPDRKTELGGALRRKAIVDSVRAAVPDMLLIDAGDAVQGSLFFTLFGGEVERMLMNVQGYDMAIVGNHEFDNGLSRLAENYRHLDAELLASNYDFSATELDGLFLPYSIRQYGDRRIAFIAINIQPEGLIDAGNYRGLVYNDAIATANKLAGLLKSKEKADMVVAITHIGYKTDDPDAEATDPMLARGSKDIDVIIGGHSHTLIPPASPESTVMNLDGRPVLVAQTGKNGYYIGEIDIDLETLVPTYRLIAVDSRLDDRIDAELERTLQTYRLQVDSIASIKIGKTKTEMPSGGAALLNLSADIVKQKAEEHTGVPVDLAVMNKGGIRSSLSKGDITRGDIMTIFPFDNRICVLEMKGSVLHALIDNMSSRGGQGLSEGMDVTMDKAAGKASRIVINGESLDEDRVYRVATIDYLAKGNDYLVEFKGQPMVYRSATPIAEDIIDYIKKAGTVKSSDKDRMHY